MNYEEQSKLSGGERTGTPHSITEDVAYKLGAWSWWERGVFTLDEEFASELDRHKGNRYGRGVYQGSESSRTELSRIKGLNGGRKTERKRGENQKNEGANGLKYEGSGVFLRRLFGRCGSRGRWRSSPFACSDGHFWFLPAIH